MGLAALIGQRLTSLSYRRSPTVVDQNSNNCRNTIQSESPGLFPPPFAKSNAFIALARVGAPLGETACGRGLAVCLHSR